MKTKTCAFRVLAVSFAGTLSLQAAIQSEETREQRLTEARLLIEREVVSISASDIAVAPNPFSPDLGIAKKNDGKKPDSRQLPDRELLEKLSQTVKPTGLFRLGSEYVLIFSEARVKAGMAVTMSYQGSDYELLVVSVTNNGYTLRYKEEEIQLKLK